MEPEHEQRRYDQEPGALDNDVLRCTRSYRNGSAIIHAVGEVDWATAPILREALAPALATDPPAMIVDLSGVSFLDSSGLSVLLRAHQEAKHRGGSILLAGPRGTVRKVLRMTDTDRVLAVYDTLEAALRQDGPPTAGAEARRSLGPARELDDWPRAGWNEVSPINLN